jgi:hypothetical protein
MEAPQRLAGAFVAEENFYATGQLLNEPADKLAE